MKLNYWGKFVDDNDASAKYDVYHTCTKLLVTLINKFDILKGEICEFYAVTRWDKTEYIDALSEYLDYNVHDFDDFTISNSLIYIGCGDIKMPLNILKSLDRKCEYRMVVVGEPGEVHYLLKENKTLLDCVNDNQGLISFSIKSGEELYFMKNNINNGYYTREEYIPGVAIRSKVFRLENMMKYDNVNNKKVCSASAFNYPEFFDYNYLTRQISVVQQEDCSYEITTLDCDDRLLSTETRDGDSLYSVYYQYMIEKGYFGDKGISKIKK